MEKYPAKILLFGEYTVLRGSSALAMPWSVYCGQWAEYQSNPVARQWNLTLAEYADYLAQNTDLHPLLDVEGMQRQVAGGLWFDSSIPRGGGLGSSGALTAAVAQRFGKTLPADLHQLRQVLAAMESFFHGNSSGIDPLTAFLHQPVAVRGNETFAASLPFADDGCPWQLFLYPTGGSSSTGLSVKNFLQSKKNRDIETMKELNNVLIDSILENDWDTFEQNLYCLSGQQMSFFEPLLSRDSLVLMADGLKSKQFVLKLCGSGGAFLLGFVHCTSDFSLRSEFPMAVIPLTGHQAFLSNSFLSSNP